MMRLPYTDPDHKGSIDSALVEKMADTFLSGGFTYFDTAYYYHEFASEKAFGKAVAGRVPREKYMIASKMPVSMLKTEKDQERIFEEQLSNCGVLYFDRYLLHNLNTSCMETANRFDTIGFLHKKKEEGKIGKLGFSCHDTPEFLEKVLQDYPELEFVQLQINYLDWDNKGIQSRRCYETAVRYDREVIVMEPVKGGTLADIPEQAEKILRDVHPDWTPASWAIRFAASLPGVSMVLSGMNTLEQVEDNMRAVSEADSMGQAELAALEKVKRILGERTAIPCTGCRYCVEESKCPMNIAIPEYFALYNQEKLDTNTNWSPQKGVYGNMVQKGYGRMQDCIGCGCCESVCPQHIEIRVWLDRASDFFDAEGFGRTIRGDKITKSGKQF